MKQTTRNAALVLAALAAGYVGNLLSGATRPAAAQVTHTVTVAPESLEGGRKSPYSVAVTDKAVTVTNTSAVAQTVSAWLNGTWGWRCVPTTPLTIQPERQPAALPAGKSITIPLDRFCREDGERFDVSAHAVLSIGLSYTGNVPERGPSTAAVFFNVSDD